MLNAIGYFEVAGPTVAASSKAVRSDPLVSLCC